MPGRNGLCLITSLNLRTTPSAPYVVNHGKQKACVNNDQPGITAAESMLEADINREQDCLLGAARGSGCGASSDDICGFAGGLRNSACVN